MGEIRRPTYTVRDRRTGVTVTRTSRVWWIPYYRGGPIASGRTRGGLRVLTDSAFCADSWTWAAVLPRCYHGPFGASEARSRNARLTLGFIGGFDGAEGRR